MKTNLSSPPLLCRIMQPLFIFTVCLALLPSVSAQQDEKKAEKKAEKTAAIKTEKTEEPKKSRKESEYKGQSRELVGDWFLTKEQNPVKLSAMYYYGDADKETTPVLLLHDINGRSGEYSPLINLLTSAGYAVLAPDLRGHGISTKRYEITMPETTGHQNRNQQQVGAAMPQKKLNNEYKVEDFQTEDFVSIFTADLPLLRKTLTGLHDKGLINMNRFVIVGAGRSAALAAILAAHDWQNKDSDKFTRTLVLIAPSAFLPGAETMASTSAAHTAAMPRQSNAGNFPANAMQRISLMQNTAVSPAMLAALDDFTRGFRGNKFIAENLAVLTAVPQGDTQSAEIAAKFRNIVLGKDDKNDKKSEKEQEKEKELEANFPLYSYPTQKKVKTGEGKDAKETAEDMKFAEILSSSEAHLGQTVFTFINKRNKEFLDSNKYKWTRRK